MRDGGREVSVIAILHREKGMRDENREVSQIGIIHREKGMRDGGREVSVTAILHREKGMRDGNREVSVIGILHRENGMRDGGREVSVIAILYREKGMSDGGREVSVIIIRRREILPEGLLHCALEESNPNAQYKTKQEIKNSKQKEWEKLALCMEGSHFIPDNVYIPFPAAQSLDETGHMGPSEPVYATLPT